MCDLHLGSYIYIYRCVRWKLIMCDLHLVKYIYTLSDGD